MPGWYKPRLLIGARIVSSLISKVSEQFSSIQKATWNQLSTKRKGWILVVLQNILGSGEASVKVHP